MRCTTKGRIEDEHGLGGLDDSRFSCRRSIQWRCSVGGEFPRRTTSEEIERRRALLIERVQTYFVVVDICFGNEDARRVFIFLSLEIIDNQGVDRTDQQRRRSGGGRKSNLVVESTAQLMNQTASEMRLKASSTNRSQIRENHPVVFTLTLSTMPLDFIRSNNFNRRSRPLSPFGSIVVILHTR